MNASALACPASLKGVLSAREAAEALVEGIGRGAVALPVADGGDPQHAERRVLGRLQHQRVAGYQRHRDLERAEKDWRVPGDDRADHADRSANDETHRLLRRQRHVPPRRRATSDQSGVDLRDPPGLPLADAVGEQLPAVPLALEVVDEHGQPVPGRGAEVVLGAVAAEYPAAGVGVVDVAALPDERVPGGGQYPDVDAPLVVAVDDHHVRVPGPSVHQQPRVGEPLERDPALRFDDAEDVRRGVLDDPRGVEHARLVDPVGGQLDPADPVAAPAGHELRRPVPWPAQQPAPVLP